jgi:hypothetical protein
MVDGGDDGGREGKESAKDQRCKELKRETTKDDLNWLSSMVERKGWLWVGEQSGV